MALKIALQQLSEYDLCEALDHTLKKGLDDSISYGQQMVERARTDYPQILDALERFNDDAPAEEVRKPWDAMIMGARVAVMTVVELSETLDLRSNFPEIDDSMIAPAPLKHELQQFTHEDFLMALRQTWHKGYNNPNNAGRHMVALAREHYPQIPKAIDSFDQLASIGAHGVYRDVFMLGVQVVFQSLIELSETQDLRNRFPGLNDTDSL